jgi:hypothetical protein
MVDDIDGKDWKGPGFSVEQYLLFRLEMKLVGDSAGKMKLVGDSAGKVRQWQQ